MDYHWQLHSRSSARPFTARHQLFQERFIANPNFAKPEFQMDFGRFLQYTICTTDAFQIADQHTARHENDSE